MNAAYAGCDDPAIVRALIMVSLICELFRDMRFFSFRPESERFEPPVSFSTFIRNSFTAFCKAVRSLCLLPRGFHTGPAFERMKAPFRSSLPVYLIGSPPFSFNLPIWSSFVNRKRELETCDHVILLVSLLIPSVGNSSALMAFSQGCFFVLFWKLRPMLLSAPRGPDSA